MKLHLSNNLWFCMFLPTWVGTPVAAETKWKMDFNCMKNWDYSLLSWCLYWYWVGWFFHWTKPKRISNLGLDPGTSFLPQMNMCTVHTGKGCWQVELQILATDRGSWHWELCQFFSVWQNRRHHSVKALAFAWGRQQSRWQIDWLHHDNGQGFQI